MNNDTNKINLGIYKGVFIPTILTIFGVILYLRIGIITGEIGLIKTISIISLATLLTLITSFSISSLASNMKLKNGGLYYITSRILGIEIGAAIGLSIYLAQAIGISFYISGFTESVAEFIPSANPTVISAVSLIGLISISIFFPKMVINLQTIILIIIVISLVAAFYGLWSQDVVLDNIEIKSNDSYWKYFALFFPAVTGIESGISFAGEIRNPRKAIPLGMISAVILGYVIYVALSYSLDRFVPNVELISNPQVLAKYSKYHKLFFLGLWSASLSSALTTINGAPMILYQIAQDKIVPKVFLRVLGQYNRPYVCQLLTTLIAGIALYLGDLNIIAPVLSMFFLCSYAILNFMCSIQWITNNPLWRPTFRFPWIVALLSAILCLLIMLLIDTVASYLCFTFIIMIYYYTKSKDINVNWQDIRPRINLFSIKKSLETLTDKDPIVDHWIPNLILPTRVSNINLDQISLGHSIIANSGFLTLFFFIPQEKKLEQNNLFKQYIKRVVNFYEDKLYLRIINCTNITQTLPIVFQSYGIGPIKPNTLMISTNEYSPEEISDILYHGQTFDHNILLVHNLNLSDKENEPEENKESRVNTQHNIFDIRDIDILNINLWITQTSPNAAFMILLSQLIKRNADPSRVKVIFNTIVSTKEEEEGVKNKFESLIETKRLDQYGYNIHYSESEKDVLEQIASHNLNPDIDKSYPQGINHEQKSLETSLTLMGLKRPTDNQSEYTESIRVLLQKFEKSENIIFTLSDTKTPFDKIYKDHS